MVTLSIELVNKSEPIELEGITTFLFDLDGTLIDSLDLHIEAFQWILDELGKDVDREELEPLMGKTPQDIIKKFFSDMSREELIDAATQKENKLAEIIEGVYVYPGIESFLQELVALEVNCLVISSTHRRLVRILLEKAGLWKYLDDIVSGDEVSKGKPDPEPFQKGVDKAGVCANQVISIGDSIHDFQSATAAGTHFLGILTGKTDLEKFEEVGCELIIESMDSIKIRE